jgi:hypothetical protein
LPLFQLAHGAFIISPEFFPAYPKFAKIARSPSIIGQSLWPPRCLLRAAAVSAAEDEKRGIRRSKFVIPLALVTAFEKIQP